MSNVATIRAAVLAQVRSLLPEVAVVEARHPSMSFALAVQTPAAVVCYAGKPQREAGPIGNRLKQGYSFAFTIALVDRNVQAPAESSHLVADLAERLMAIRGIPLGTIADETLYLKFVSESGEIDAGAGAQGGLYAMVQQWQTEPVRI